MEQESSHLWRLIDENLYSVLGVPPEATGEQIQRAWRAAAGRLHPDRGGDPARFRSVHVAYLVLSDPVERRAYDRTLVTATSQYPVTLPDLSEASRSPHGNPVLLWLFAIGASVAILGAYLWPGFTIVTAVVVATVVLVRYQRMGFGLVRRR